ncbi:hypothetical protein E2C01_040569 [Portunus trituberculatus]|uniref:Uncharacterized protein n=1 Tax=Portunus trituberculatus TaxID=210409 RepID=A0A5B7FNK8_PORTR|nr:hypothetical protein [Portunus trituberculatus]
MEELEDLKNEGAYRCASCLIPIQHFQPELAGLKHTFSGPPSELQPITVPLAKLYRLHQHPNNAKPIADINQKHRTCIDSLYGPRAAGLALYH